MWRSFDVGSVVDSLIDDAVVVAGAKGTSRRVHRARTADTADDLRRADAYDLVVVTATSLFACDEGWNQPIASLAAAQVAGLTVRLDPAEPLPPDLLAAADRAAFPIITFPDTMAPGDVTIAVLDALLTAQGQRLERFLEIHQRFTPVMLAGGGATEIAAMLHTLVGYPVLVLDTGGDRTVVVPSDADIDVDAAVTSGVRQPILAGDQDYGAVVVMTGGLPLDADQLLAVERAATAIAVRLAHASAVAAEQERFATTSLEELIAGHAGDTADITERALSFGWDLSRPRAVLLASIDPPTDPNTLQSALATIAASARATLGPDAIVWTRSTTIAALVAPVTGESVERRRIAEALRHDLDDRISTVTISIGVGGCVDDPRELPRSYVEASRSVDVGRWAKGRHVTEVFDELGLERLLASTPADDLAGFVQQTIGALVEYDHLHRSDLVATLGVWLETRNMAEASRVVHVHYNTFKNRLDRIESILGPIVTDAARALECEVAIYISRHYDGPWTTLDTV
jgi:purine catabolism regulator